MDASKQGAQGAPAQAEEEDVDQLLADEAATDAGATPSSTKKGLGTVICYRTAKTIARDQEQVSIEGLDPIFRKNGIQQTGKKGGLSAQEGRYALVTLQFKDQSEGDVVMGDTHGVWAKHQTDDTRPTFDRLYEACQASGRRAKVTVIKVEAYNDGSSGPVEVFEL